VKTGIVDVGGGLRGIFGAGIYDYCLEHQIYFDDCIGVSAGSANIACYLAGQKGRDIAFYTEYPFRRQYMSFWNFLTKGSYLDLHYLYGTLSVSDGENPLDFAALQKNSSEMTVVASEAVSGKVKYFHKSDMKRDHYDVLCASCCLPAICKPYPVNGVLYYDGALGDPVPVQKALDDGCDKIVLVLTKPRNLLRDSVQDSRFARRIARKYPKAAQNLCQRAEHYNDGVAFAKELEKKGKVLILAPDRLPAIGSLTRDKKVLLAMYQCGHESATAIPDFFRSPGKN